MPNFCTNCGAPVNPHANFCGNCGARIIDTQAVDPVEAAARFEKYDSEGNTVEQLPNIDPVKPVEKRVSAEERIQREEDSDWESVKDSNDIAKLSSFLSNYGMYSRYALVCRERMRELEEEQKAINRQDETIRAENDWITIQTSDNIEKFSNYLSRYGNDCRHATDCRRRIQELYYSQSNDDDTCWYQAKEANSIHWYRDYSLRYPTGKHIKECKNTITDLEENTAWNDALKNNTLEWYQAYLTTFGPNGKHSAECNTQIQELEKRTQHKKESIYNNFTEYKKTRKAVDILETTFLGIFWLSIIGLGIWLKYKYL